jgi:hypothetical protein
LTGEAGSVEPGYWRRKIRSRSSPSTPEAAVPVETLKPPLLQSTPKTERKNNPIMAIDQQCQHIDSRQKTAPAWRSNPAIQHQHFTEAQKPPPPQSDRNPKEENQKLETGKTSADTPQNRFSIPKRTRKKPLLQPKKVEKKPLLHPEKDEKKHHPFTSKEPTKPEERKKFIEKQIYHKPLGRREAEGFPPPVTRSKDIFAFREKKKNRQKEIISNPVSPL